MICTECSAPAPDGDTFCEGCGARLHTAATAAEGTCPCGAPGSERDVEGYCLRCGRMAARPTVDHVVLESGPGCAGVSDRGLLHPRNEDRIAIEVHGTRCVLAVCDGVSASEDPAAAAGLATEALTAALRPALQGDVAGNPEALLRDAFEQASAALATAADGVEDSEASATTAVIAWVDASSITVAWVGDSRAYWVDASRCVQLTGDHSWAREAVDGGWTEEDAAAAPMAHSITRWLGADAGERATPDLAVFRPEGPGYLLLCSDGLWNYLPAAEALGAAVRTQAAAAGPVLAACEGLVGFALSEGGRDNVSVVLCAWPFAAAVDPAGEDA